MSGLVERAARAMMRDLERQGEPYGAGPLYDTPDTAAELLPFVVIDGTVDMLALARAAIAEMREPTQAMHRAGLEAPQTVAEIWEAMIENALAEKTPPSL